MRVGRYGFRIPSVSLFLISLRSLHQNAGHEHHAIQRKSMRFGCHSCFSSDVAVNVDEHFFSSLMSSCTPQPSPQSPMTSAAAGNNSRRSGGSAMLESRTSLAEIPFIEAVPDDLQCGICFCAATDPVVTEECGHLFCRDCLYTALERKRECPIDRLPLSLDEIRKDIRALRKIQSLMVSCHNQKAGCTWVGNYSDLERHSERCELATVKCPFSAHGCDAVVSRKTLPEHMTASMNSHMVLLCHVTSRLADENLMLQQELDILQREDLRFVWVITNFEAKRGPVYSRKFVAKSLQWYLGIDFEGPEKHAGVYLFAEGHTKRVDFKLILFNSDSSRDKVHVVNDWAHDYKGKGWGPLKFIDRSNLATSGFIASGCVRIGVEIEADPFE